jgi:peptide alpha-N-acetyltransferase
MGTIYKQKKDFYESSKCFLNAYKYEPENIQLLKDIASMQIQIRDHSAHVQSRLGILKLKPNMIQNWIGFILANHLVLIYFNFIERRL